MTVRVETGSGEVLDRVVGDGNEHVRVLVDDVDDPQTSFVGDLTSSGLVASLFNYPWTFLVLKAARSFRSSRPQYHSREAN